jgi:type I restriction enzyme R subunit
VLNDYGGELAVFLDFVLGQYVKQGVDELDQEKLPRLLELRYANVREAATLLGGVPTVRRAFVDCQRGLFMR